MVQPPRVCNLPQYNHVSAFGSIFDGWSVATNSTPSLLVGIDGGSVVALDDTEGWPDAGSIKLTVPFSDVNQQILFAQAWPTGINLTGTTITAQLKLDSGLNTSPENSGQAFLVVKSTASYAYAPAAPVNLDASAGWVTITLDADAPLAALPFGYWACDIREIDVVILTGEKGTYAEAELHIDTIAVTSKTPEDGGADGAAGAAP